VFAVFAEKCFVGIRFFPVLLFVDALPRSACREVPVLVEKCLAKKCFAEKCLSGAEPEGLRQAAHAAVGFGHGSKSASCYPAPDRVAAPGQMHGGIFAQVVFDPGFFFDLVLDGFSNGAFAARDPLSAGWRALLAGAASRGFR
jgi:hypothetical protein